MHPFYEVDAGYKRLSPVFLADYATADDGTGIVHSSPAYGVEDFNSCVANGIAYDEILNPVQGNGRYVDDLPLFGGLNIWKAAPLVIDTLREHGRLFATVNIEHSYPHCWRHKTPVITAQPRSGLCAWMKKRRAPKVSSPKTKQPSLCANWL